MAFRCVTEVIAMSAEEQVRRLRAAGVRDPADDELYELGRSLLRERAARAGVGEAHSRGADECRL